MNWLINKLGWHTKKQVANKIAEAEKVQTAYWADLAFDVETDNMEKQRIMADSYCGIFLSLAGLAKECRKKSSHLERLAKTEKGRALALEIDIKLRRDQ